MFPPPGTNGLPRKPETHPPPAKHDLASRLSAGPASSEGNASGLNIRGHAEKRPRPAESTSAPRDELHIRSSANRDAPHAPVKPERDDHARSSRELPRDSRDREPRGERGEAYRRDYDRRDNLPPRPPIHDGPRDRDFRNGQRSPRAYDRRDDRDRERERDRARDRDLDRDRERDREHRRPSPTRERHNRDRHDAYGGDRGRYDSYAPRDVYEGRRRDTRDYPDYRDDRRYRDDRSRPYDRRDDHRRHERDNRRSSPSKREDGEVQEDGEIPEPAPRADPKPSSPTPAEPQRRRSRSPATHAPLPPRPATPPLPLPRSVAKDGSPKTKPPPAPPPKDTSAQNRPPTPPPKEARNGRPPTPPGKEGIKSRPSEPTASPPPPPPDDLPPPPPPPGAPPPPPSDTPSATPDAPPAAKKSYAPRPHAPNRNLAEASSTPRALTPQPSGGLPQPQIFRIPTVKDEMDAYGRKFAGVTTLASYDLGDKLGEGTFGVVTKATDRKTRKMVALKKLITHNPRDGVSVTTVREIKILKELHHANIVPILDMVVERKVPGDRSRRGEVFMVFPYMDHDLCGLLLNKDFRMTHSVAKLLLRQILEGLAYMHGNNIIHRDLKTANILVSEKGEVMIADFGLARTLGTEPLPKHSKYEYTNMVVTRWYRAPQLLLGDVHYGPAIDLWSMGCILGEMYLREPIFPGDSDRDQLLKIFARVEPPNQRVWPGWDKLPGFPDAKNHQWDKTHKETNLLNLARKWQMDRAGADLMVKLLALDPSKRPTATEALNHVWFWSEPMPAKLGNIPVVTSSHEMTTRERAPAHRPRAVQPPAWVRPPPQAHPRQGHGRHGHQGQQHQLHRSQMHQQPHLQQPPQGYMPPGVPNMGMGMAGGPGPHGYAGNMGPGPGPANHPNNYGRGPPMGGPPGGVMNQGGGRGPPPPFKLAGQGGGGPAGLPPNPNPRVPAPAFRLAGGRQPDGPSFGGNGSTHKRGNQGEPRGRDKRPRVDGSSLPY